MCEGKDNKNTKPVKKGASFDNKDFAFNFFERELKIYIFFHFCYLHFTADQSGF